MKNSIPKSAKLFLLILFVFFTSCFSIKKAIAQPPFATRVATNRALLNTNVTSKTGSHSITPLNVGYSIDSAFQLMLSFSTLTCGCDLQNVLNNGNNATDASGGINSFSLTSSTNNSIFSPNHILLQDASFSNSIDIYSGSSVNNPYIALYDLPYATGNKSKILSGSLTAQRSVLLPDEGNGSGVASTIVLHNTKDDITINSGIGQSTVINTSSIYTKSGSVNFTSLAYNINYGILTLRDNVGGFNSSIFPTTLSATRSVLLPDEGNGSGVASTIVLHNTKDSISVNNGSGFTTMSNNSFRQYNSSGTMYAYLGTGYVGTLTPHLMLKDIASNSWSILFATPSSVNGTTAAYLPDEPASASITDNTLVKHKTKDQITITSGSDINTLSTSAMTVDNGIGNVGTFSTTQASISQASGGISQSSNITFGTLNLSYSDAGTSTSLQQSISFNSPVSGTTASYGSFLPLVSGTLLADFHGTYSTTLTAATTAIITIPAAGGYVFTGINLDAKNAATGVILQTAHYTSAIGSGTATITFASPVSGAFNVSYQLY